MMSASVPQNGLPEMGTRSPSNSMDDEESFVVLDRCVDEVNGQCISLQCSEATESIESASSAIAASVSLLTLQTMTNSATTTTPSTPPPTINVGNVSSTTMVTSQESNLSGASELSAEEIQQKMGSLYRENIELKDTLTRNTSVFKKKYEDLAKWHAEVVEVQKSHIIKFEETKRLVRDLKAENAELRKLANTTNDSSKEVVNLKSKISALEFELDTLRQANAKCSVDQSKIIQQLELKLSESEKNKFEESTKYKNQIDNLASQLSHVEVEYDKLKEELVEVKKKLPTEVDAANIEIMKGQLTELTQEVLLKNRILKEKMDLIDQLHETISKLKIDNERIPILSAQVEVYQTDFNQERQEREKLKTEKDKIAEDLKHLHRRNQKLLEQIDIMQTDPSFVPVSEASNSASAQAQAGRSTPSREQSPPLTVFTCPICTNTYRNLVSCQEHVDRCLLQSSPEL